MSETLTIGTGTATIYGSFTGAVAYFDVSGSDAAAAWITLADDTARKKKLADATRYLNRLGWAEGYTTFALRDALFTGVGSPSDPGNDGDASYPFRAAMYELAALASADPDVLTIDDQGSNVSGVGAGGAFVNFFSPTSASRGTASMLPTVVMNLIGQYLAGAATGSGSADGSSGSCENPFGPSADYDRNRSW